MIFFSLFLNLPEFEPFIPQQQHKLNLEREDNTGAENPTQLFPPPGISLPAQVSFVLALEPRGHVHSTHGIDISVLIQGCNYWS